MSSVELCLALWGGVAAYRRHRIRSDLTLARIWIWRAMLTLRVLFERENFSEHIGVTGLTPCMKNLTASHDEPDTRLSTEKTANCEDHGSPLARGKGCYG